MLASTGLGCSLTVGTIVALFGNIFMEAICSLAGATPSILPCAKALIGTIFWGWSWMCFALMLNMQIRFEGEGLSAILAIMSGAHITVFSNPSSVFGANLRVVGSALSNIACQGISFVALVTIMQRNGLMPFHLKYVRLSKAFFHGINRGGIPSFACQRMSAAAGALLNNAAIAFGDVVVMASVNRITSFANYLQRGIGQGFRSVLGYNLGARNFRWTEQDFLLGASGVLCRACSRCCYCDLCPTADLFLQE